MSAPATPAPSAADVLRTALEIIPDEQHWMQQGAYAEAGGELIMDEIELYNAYGAGTLERCCVEAALLLAHRRLHVPVGVGPGTPWGFLRGQLRVANLADFNDSPHTTYAEIANAFRRAIAVAEGWES